VCCWDYCCPVSYLNLTSIEYRECWDLWWCRAFLYYCLCCLCWESFCYWNAGNDQNDYGATLLAWNSTWTGSACSTAYGNYVGSTDANYGPPCARALDPGSNNDYARNEVLLLRMLLFQLLIQMTLGIMLSGIRSILLVMLGMLIVMLVLVLIVVMLLLLFPPYCRLCWFKCWFNCSSWECSGNCWFKWCSFNCCFINWINHHIWMDQVNQPDQLLRTWWNYSCLWWLCSCFVDRQASSFPFHSVPHFSPLGVQAPKLRIDRMALFYLFIART